MASAIIALSLAIVMFLLSLIGVLFNFASDFLNDLKSMLVSSTLFYNIARIAPTPGKMPGKTGTKVLFYHGLKQHMELNAYIYQL